MTTGGALIDVLGGDLFVSDGSVLYMWNNRSRSGAPAGLYRALEYPPAGGDVVFEYIGTGSDGSHFFTGASLYSDGLIIGANRVAEFHTQSPADASDQAVYWMYTNDGPFYNHNFGDMAGGPFAGCTRSKGYYKNHSWNGDVVYVNGEIVDEALGQSILWHAKGKNWSMFFAQLITAKLNCPTCAVVVAADSWLLTQNVDDWYARFDSRAQKATANTHKDALDAFNNSRHCP
jgi:hypothetical protein